MHKCECGHLGSDHDNLIGRCSGDCFDPEYGTFRCLCPMYQHEGDN